MSAQKSAVRKTQMSGAGGTGPKAGGGTPPVGGVAEQKEGELTGEGKPVKSADLTTTPRFARAKERLRAEKERLAAGGVPGKEGTTIGSLYPQGDANATSINQANRLNIELNVNRAESELMKETYTAANVDMFAATLRTKLSTKRTAVQDFSAFPYTADMAGMVQQVVGGESDTDRATGTTTTLDLYMLNLSTATEKYKELAVGCAINFAKSGGKGKINLFRTGAFETPGKSPDGEGGGSGGGGDAEKSVVSGWDGEQGFNVSALETLFPHTVLSELINQEEYEAACINGKLSPSDWGKTAAARGLQKSHGLGTDKDMFGGDGAFGDALFDEVVMFVGEIGRELQAAEQYFMEASLKSSEQCETLRGEIRNFLMNDIVTLAGGSKVFQAAYCNLERVVVFFINANPTPAIQKCVKREVLVTAQRSSPSGYAMLVQEKYANFSNSVIQAVNGVTNSSTDIDNKVHELNEMVMTSGEAASDFLDRVLWQYTSITEATMNMLQGKKKITQLVSTGTIDLKKLGSQGIYSSGVYGPGDMVFMESMHAVAQASSITPGERTVDKMLEQFNKFVEAIDRAQAAQVYGQRGSKKSSGKAKPAAKKKSWAQMAAAEEDSDDDIPAEQDIFVEKVIAALKAQGVVKSGGGKENNGKAGSGSGKSKGSKDQDRQARFDKMAEAGYPQVVLPFFEGLCRYCGKKGHNKEICAREAWDNKHDCRLAHASDIHVDFCRQRGWTSARPAAGTFPPFVEGGSSASAGKAKKEVKFSGGESGGAGGNVAADKLDKILARLDDMEKVTSDMAGVLADFDEADDDEGS